MKKFSSRMRTNSRRTSQNSNAIRILLAGVILIGLLFVLPRLFAFSVSFVVTPINATKSWFANSSASLPQYLRDRSKLVDQISDLQQQLATSGGATYTVKLLSSENQKLRNLLNNTKTNLILAGVIGRPDELPYDVLVLDKGSSDGIVANAPVFVGDDTVIGVVEKTFLHSSVVELITSPHFKASVFILGPNIYTNAEGLGGGQLRVGVPQGVNLSEGDLVILPSVLSGIYGQITYINSKPSDPLQYGYVSPQIPIQSIHLVGVGSTPLQPVTFQQAQQIITQEKTNVMQIDIPDNILSGGQGSSTATSTDTATSTASSTTS